MKPTKEDALKYRLKNIGEQHARAWRRDIERRKGLEAADIFAKYVNEINNKKILK